MESLKQKIWECFGEIERKNFLDHTIDALRRRNLRIKAKQEMERKRKRRVIVTMPVKRKNVGSKKVMAKGESEEEISEKIKHVIHKDVGSKKVMAKGEIGEISEKIKHVVQKNGISRKLMEKGESEEEISEKVKHVVQKNGINKKFMEKGESEEISEKIQHVVQKNLKKKSIKKKSIKKKSIKKKVALNKRITSNKENIIEKDMFCGVENIKTSLNGNMEIEHHNDFVINIEDQFKNAPIDDCLPLDEQSNEKITFIGNENILPDKNHVVERRLKNIHDSSKFNDGNVTLDDNFHIVPDYKFDNIFCTNNSDSTKDKPCTTDFHMMSDIEIIDVPAKDSLLRNETQKINEILQSYKRELERTRETVIETKKKPLKDRTISDLKRDAEALISKPIENVYYSKTDNLQPTKINFIGKTLISKFINDIKCDKASQYIAKLQLPVIDFEGKLEKSYKPEPWATDLRISQKVKAQKHRDIEEMFKCNDLDVVKMFPGVQNVTNDSPNKWAINK